MDCELVDPETREYENFIRDDVSTAIGWYKSCTEDA